MSQKKQLRLGAIIQENKAKPLPPKLPTLFTPVRKPRNWHVNSVSTSSAS